MVFSALSSSSAVRLGTLITLFPSILIGVMAARGELSWRFLNLSFHAVILTNRSKLLILSRFHSIVGEFLTVATVVMVFLASPLT